MVRQRDAQPARREIRDAPRPVDRLVTWPAGHDDFHRGKALAESALRVEAGNVKGSRLGGGADRIRTCDLLIANETLYQLSYTPNEKTLILTTYHFNPRNPKNYN